MATGYERPNRFHRPNGGSEFVREANEKSHHAPHYYNYGTYTRYFPLLSNSPHISKPETTPVATFSWVTDVGPFCSVSKNSRASPSLAALNHQWDRSGSALAFCGPRMLQKLRRVFRAFHGGKLDGCHNICVVIFWSIHPRADRPCFH
jgi:hypothetical protein